MQLGGVSAFERSFFSPLFFFSDLISPSASSKILYSAWLIRFLASLITSVFICQDITSSEHLFYFFFLTQSFPIFVVQHCLPLRIRDLWVCGFHQSPVFALTCRSHLLIPFVECVSWMTFYLCQARMLYFLSSCMLEFVF